MQVRIKLCSTLIVVIDEMNLKYSVLIVLSSELMLKCKQTILIKYTCHCYLWKCKDKYNLANVWKQKYCISSKALRLTFW